MLHTLILNGLAINYSDQGSGPVLVMLHGWGSSLKAFDGLTQMLSKDFRVVRIDLPGFGGSEQPKQDWHMQEYAECLQGILARLQITDAYAIIGHSFGGRVAIKAIGTNMLQPGKLILMDSGGVRESRSVRNQLLKAIAKVGKAVTSLPGLRSVQAKLRKALYRSIGSTDYLQSGPMKQIFLHTINEDLQADAAQINTPTLLLWGANDNVTPLAHGRLLAHAMPNAELRVIPAAGHFVFIDQPVDILAELRRFLA